MTIYSSPDPANSTIFLRYYAVLKENHSHILHIYPAFMKLVNSKCQSFDAGIPFFPFHST